MATAPTTKARDVLVPGEPTKTNAGATEVDAPGKARDEGDESDHPAVIALRELEAKLAAAQAELEAAKSASKGEPAQVFDMTKPHQTGKGWIVPETHGAPVKKG